MRKQEGESPGQGTGGIAAMVSASFLWAVVSLIVVFGRMQILPIYSDFEVELPGGTKWLFERTTLILLGFVTLGTPVIWWLLSSAKLRNLFSGLSVTLVVLFGLLCIYAFIIPCLSLVQSLG